MYDYLGGEQVKLFYIPVFSKSSTRRGQEAHTWHSGGLLRSFSKGGATLPLKTLYYKYPQQFMIVDEEDIWIVKDGKLYKQTTLSDLAEEDMITPVFGRHGTEINIKSLPDFQAMQEEHTALYESRKKVEKEYFPNGTLHMMQNDLPQYEVKKEEWEQAENELSTPYYEKWFPIDSYEEEKRFGEAIDCYIILKSRRDEPPFGNHSPKEEYEACLSYVKELIKKNPSITQDYINWLDNETLLEKIDFSSLLQDFQ